MQLIKSHVDKQCASLTREMEEEVKSRNMLRWDAEAGAGLLRGQVFDLQQELQEAIADIGATQERHVALTHGQQHDIEQLHKRARLLEADREELRESLIQLQHQLQTNNEAEAKRSMLAGTLQGSLRVAATSAQSRVYQVESQNATLRQTLQEVTLLSRTLVQDSYASLLIHGELDILDEQHSVTNVVASLHADVVTLTEQLEGTRASLDEHAVARCRLEFEAADAGHKLLSLTSAQARLNEHHQSIGTGESCLLYVMSHVSYMS